MLDGAYKVMPMKLPRILAQSAKGQGVLGQFGRRYRYLVVPKNNYKKNLGVKICRNSTDLHSKMTISISICLEEICNSRFVGKIELDSSI